MLTTVLIVSLFTVFASKREQSFWGRIYLKGGIDPIQYFRANYGRPPPNAEHDFFFPSNRLGCKDLPANEAQSIGLTNSIVVLDRGECTFETKTLVAQKAGASSVVIVSLTEETKAPVGNLDGDSDITIATTMIRHSGGELLRQSYQRMSELKGRLIPIYCEKINGSNVCNSTTTEDYEYTISQVGGGKILHKSQVIGEFLTARYGGPLSLNTTFSTYNAIPPNGCDYSTVPLEAKGKAVVIERGGCSFLEKIQYGYHVGATMVILSFLTPSIHRIDVPEKWMGYNVSLPIIAISSTTAATMAKFNEFTLIQQNSIGSAWDEIHSLSTTSGWPSKRSKREQLVKQFLINHRGNQDREYTIREYFLDVAGGTDTALRTVLSHDEL